ncbi:hypothetical protein EDB81DRAFT_877675 [Dactylonectria macrodidyma]|uniref:Uncharacterized protein n=1 Tax=Dactylonectria macrodidyma TaxID=307937 RepID=A0A9P9FLB6_9HYPO|nr:hypothetical protein EDB81DRAFT_877675 [Dactylonectria macrodidyma]
MVKNYTVTDISASTHLLRNCPAKQSEIPSIASDPPFRTLTHTSNYQTTNPSRSEPRMPVSLPATVSRAGLRELMLLASFNAIATSLADPGLIAYALGEIDRFKRMTKKQRAAALKDIDWSLPELISNTVCDTPQAIARPENISRRRDIGVPRT